MDKAMVIDAVLRVEKHTGELCLIICRPFSGYGEIIVPPIYGEGLLDDNGRYIEVRHLESNGWGNDLGIGAEALIAAINAALQERRNCTSVVHQTEPWCCNPYSNTPAATTTIVNGLEVFD